MIPPYRKSVRYSCCIIVCGSVYFTQSIPYGKPCCLEPYRLRQPRIVLRHRSCCHKAFASFHQYTTNAGSGCAREAPFGKEHKAGAMLRATASRGSLTTHLQLHRSTPVCDYSCRMFTTPSPPGFCVSSRLNKKRFSSAILVEIVGGKWIWI